MISSTRSFQRAANELRPISFEKDIAPNALSSLLVSFGNTRVICAVSVEPYVPRWMKEQGVLGGWLSAEYTMLPYATRPRKQRESSRGRQDGRSIEIQRLIGRSLRAVVDLSQLEGMTFWIDCDVLQADGGTRTAAITGGSLAVALAIKRLLAAGTLTTNPMKQLLGAVSVGALNGEILLDLDYQEDSAASVDANFMMNQSLEFIEIQASGEEATFQEGDFTQMLAYAKAGITFLLEKQKKVLNDWS